MKKRLKRPAHTNQLVKRLWGDNLSHWINETGMTARFRAVLGAAFTLESSRRVDRRHAQQRLNEMLAAFSFRPVVLLPGTAGSLVGWRDSSQGRRRTLGETLEIVGSGDSEACRQLVQILEAGRLSVLRKCDCSRWFFAAKRDQVSCSTSCRKKKHEKTQAYRDRRSSRRRTRYAQNKDQENRWLKGS